MKQHPQQRTHIEFKNSQNEILVAVVERKTTPTGFAKGWSNAMVYATFPDLPAARVWFRAVFCTGVK